MRILVVMSSPEYLRFYDTTVVQLAQRGHDVRVAVNAVREERPVRLDGIEHTPRVTVAGLVPGRYDRWTNFARGVRGTMDFVRYLHPRLARAALLRARMKRQALPWTLQWMDRVRQLPVSAVNAVMRGLEAAERAVPSSDAIQRFLEAQAPDVVLVSPLVEAASDQVDIVRAAQALGIRVGTLVASWDNLTNKGDLRVATDFVAVWNDAQKLEAVEFHRVPEQAITVTGAQAFDRWFDRQPSRPREAFCRDVGLPDDRPFVLFTGSSIFIARADAEMAFVRRWIAALRASDDPLIRDVNVLVRPHPYNGRAWRADDFAGLAGVAVWPRGGYDPVDEANRAGLFDSLFHGAAIVGINTSAMIEAAIVGRPVLAIEAPEFAGTQEGTLHYRHLLPENGGFLRVSSSFPEHLCQLSGVLHDPQTSRDELDRFVRSFIRPRGREVSATSVLTDAIERYGETPVPARVRESLGTVVLRTLLRPVAAWGGLWLSPALRKQATRARQKVTAGSREVSMSRVNRSLAAAVLVPVILGLGVVAAFTAGELGGSTVLFNQPPVNVAEAAGLGITSEVVRFMDLGQDPHRMYVVRPDIISSEITKVTGLEAAIWGRRIEMIRMLDSVGALHDPAMRRHLRCLAMDISLDAVAELLASPDQPPCEPGAAAESVRARNK